MFLRKLYRMPPSTAEPGCQSTTQSMVALHLHFQFSDVFGSLSTVRSNCLCFSHVCYFGSCQNVGSSQIPHLFYIFLGACNFQSFPTQLNFCSFYPVPTMTAGLLLPASTVDYYTLTTPDVMSKDCTSSQRMVCIEFRCNCQPLLSSKCAYLWQLGRIRSDGL